MNHQSETWEVQELNRFKALLFAHGASVLLIGLIAGVILIFSMLEGIILWPILDIPYQFPGSARGWKAAHVGGITNGLLIIGMGIVLSILPLKFAAARFIFWSFLLTGWGNTIFYWAGNLSANRGLSVQDNVYGESNIAGIIAFIGGGSVMLLTIAATFLIATAAFRHAKNKSL